MYLLALDRSPEGWILRSEITTKASQYEPNSTSIDMLQTCKEIILFSENGVVLLKVGIAHLFISLADPKPIQTLES